MSTSAGPDARCSHAPAPRRRGRGRGCAGRGSGSSDGWMLSSRSRQRSTKAGGQDAHEAGEADQFDAGGARARADAPPRRRAGRRNAGDRRALPGCRLARRAPGRERRGGCRARARSARGCAWRALASISACRLEPPPEIRTATRRRAIAASSPLTRPAPGRKTRPRSPSVSTVSPAAGERAAHRLGAVGSTTSDHADAAIEGPQQLRGSSRPARGSQAKTGGSAQAPSVDPRDLAFAAARAAGSRSARRR